MINSEIKIVRATQSDADLLVDLATQTFVQSHASSAPKKDIDAYVSEKYNLPVFENELENENYVYHLLYYKGKAVGFSKIILNESHSNIKLKDVTKLERLYILDKYHDLKLGKLLFDFNVKLSKIRVKKGCGYLYGLTILEPLIFIRSADSTLLVNMILEFLIPIQTPIIK